MQHLAYRKELDGLRAIAVVSVILFHVGFRDMTGGFVGVDIFFVLSGYLICGQTYLRLEAGEYSAIEFFARRIRRLSTAYFACFLVTALIANWLFLRSEMGDVATNLLGSVTFTNNFNLLKNQGYFATAAHENPFLHTWSLSIEEQFYIVLPMVILATQRSLAAFRGVLVGLFVTSLAMVLFSGELIYDRDERFFSSVFRVWELTLGALVFVVLHKRGALFRLPFVPLFGLALVLVPVGWLDSTALYPGWVTLIPTAGAAVLIATAAPDTGFVGRFLASRGMAYIGRISYGTYLWHWPLIVFVRYAGVDLNDEIRTGLVIGSLALGAMSYHLIETPIRRIDVVRHKARLFGMFAVQTAVLLALTFYLFGEPGKAGPGDGAAIVRIKAEVMNAHPGWNACWGHKSPDTFCEIGVVGADGPDFVLWGDSMANSAFWAFEDYAAVRGQAGYLAATASCAPLAGIARDFSGAEGCLDVNRAVLEYLDTAPPMDVFLFGRWSYYAEGYRNHESNTSGQVGLVDASGQQREDENVDIFADGYRAALDRITARHRVIVINQVPVYPYSVPKEMLREVRFGTPPTPKSASDFQARSGRAATLIATEAVSRGITVVSPHEVMCAQDNCLLSMDGTPLYIDQVHLSRRGNDMLRDMILNALPE